MLFGNSSRERTLRENMKINATANGGIQETKVSVDLYSRR